MQQGAIVIDPQGVRPLPPPGTYPTSNYPPGSYPTSGYPPQGQYPSTQGGYTTVPYPQGPPNGQPDSSTYPNTAMSQPPPYSAVVQPSS